MNHIKPAALSLILFLSLSVALADPGDDKITKENVETKTEAEIKARVEVLKNRVDEIKNTDRSELDRSEKKALRHELRDIKKELRTADNTYITISLGGAIIVLLLLILIL